MTANLSLALASAYTSAFADNNFSSQLYIPIGVCSLCNGTVHRILKHPEIFPGEIKCSSCNAEPVNSNLFVINMQPPRIQYD